MGSSVLPQQVLEQHDVFAPVPMRRATSPYFSRTVALRSWVLMWSSLSRFVDGLPKKNGSAASVLAFRRRRGGREPFDQLGHLAKGVLVQRVIHPAALPAVGHQAGILQDLEVEGQP